MERLGHLKMILAICLLVIFVGCNFERVYNGDTYRIQANGLYGYIDSLGQEIIQPQYLYAEHFSKDGVALVILDTVHLTRIDTFRTKLFGNTEYQNVLKIKYGYINTANKSIFSQPSIAKINVPLNSSFSDALIDFCSRYSFEDGLAVVSDTITQKCGYINIEGDTVVSCIYLSADRFSDGLAVVQKTYNDEINKSERGKFGFIDRKGKEIIDFEYNQLGRYLNGRSIGVIYYEKHDNKEQEISGEITKDKNGRVYVDTSKRFVINTDRDDHYTYGFKKFLVDGNGHIIGNQLPLTYSYFNFGKDGYAAAVPNNFGVLFNLGCKFLKKNGEFLSPLEGITDLNIDSITKAQKSNIHLSENLKILDITRFTNGYAAVKLDKDAWVYVDKYLLVHSPLDSNQALENAGPFSYGLAPIKIDGKWGYINTDFDIVIPCIYDSCGIAERKLCKVYRFYDGVQVVSYIDRKQNIVWQQTVYNSTLNRSHNNFLQSRKDLEPIENNNLWILVITIIGVLLNLVFMIVGNLKKLIKKLFNRRINIFSLPICLRGKEKRSEIKYHFDFGKKHVQYNWPKSNFFTKCGNDVKNNSESDSSNKQSRISNEKPIVASEKLLTTESELIGKVLNIESPIKRQTKTVTIKPNTIQTISTNKDLSKESTPLRVLYFSNNNKTGTYPIISYPKYNCIVFPFRVHQINRRGYCEESFENLLKKYRTNKVQIIGNANIVLANGVRPYEPDIAIVCDSEKNIRIDIEIDEPYSGLTHEPIHFIGCGDEFRDINLANAGWIVIRFAEKQILQEPLSCVSFIYKIINELDDTIKIPEELKSLHIPTNICRWTELEAKLMALKNEREKYLHHIFGVDESEEYSLEDITQTQKERELSALLDKLSVLEGDKSRNLDNSDKSFKQDKEIKFFAKEHIYLYQDYLELRPISEVIGLFFKKFDDLKWSEIKARDNGVSQRYMLELWDCKGAESREVGSCLHSQIESYFNRKEIVDTYHFKYNGVEIKKDELVSIKKEWTQFIQFIKEKSITPFRTEWKIFDLKYRIAGTIDLLCKNEKYFDIYDWKRSDKVNPDQSAWQYGINGLEHVPDTRYYRYCLQQNLYRYILEENYQIKINRMYLVILHHSNQKYRLIEVPRMEKEIRIILDRLNQH